MVLVTLVINTIGKAVQQHTVTYTHQAALLGRQLTERYPFVPRLAVISEDLGEDDIALLVSSGFIPLKRASIISRGVVRITGVYAEQYMKFSLWNEAEHD